MAIKSWDEQIKALKEKAKPNEQKKAGVTAGRCPSCSSGRFRHEMRDRKLMRICKGCKAEKEF